MQNINKTHLSLSSLFRTITLFLALFFFNQSVSLAQCDPGAPNCADSDVIDFPFSTRMLSDINGNGEIPGCNGQGFFHNTTWYRIIPTEPFIFIDITSSNCTTVGGNQGIQLGLYPECDPNSQPVGTIQCDCAAPGQTITLGGVVTPGVPYFIMVDGCSGSTCDLSMILTVGDVQEPVINLGNPSQPMTNDPIPTCPGAELTFTIPPVNDADVYTWNFPPGTTIIEQNCNEVIVEWGPIGGNVNVTVTNLTFNDMNTGPPLFVPIDPPMYSLTREYCSPTPGGYVFYGDGVTYTEGFYNLLIPGPICDTAVQLTVIENLIAVELIIDNPTTCNAGNDGFDDGSATVFMQNNGANSYSYQWENSSITGPTNGQLPVGVTGITITDDRGCSVETFVNITEPPFLFADVTVDIPPSCENASDGEIVVFAQGGTTGTGNYNYAWTGPDGYTSNVQNPTDIGTGVHELIITDDNGCEFPWIGNIVATGGNVSATESNQSAESCTGSLDGSVTLTGDGAGIFTFTWPGPIVAATRTDLAAGTYEVTITNDSGCSGTQEVVIAAGSSFTVDAPVISDVSCFGDGNGSITIDVTGGTAPLSYTVGSGTVAGNVISDLTAGNYTLVVTDGAGCTSGDIPVVVDTPTEFLPTIANTPVTCGGSGDGTATVTPVGGTGPYTYLWGDNEDTQGITNLSGGTFTVTVTDDEGCSVSLSTEVDGGGSLGVLIDPAVTQLEVSCPGESDGTVTVTVTGATGNITYEWTGNTTSTSATASGLAPGIYSVVATDAGGCESASFEVEITAPTPLLVTEVGTTQTSCENGTDGTAEVSVSGGTGTNYTFAWDNGETTNPAVNLGPGPHTVTVRDENMCPQTLSVTIVEPVAITATIDPVDPECFGDSNGSITVNASGGSGTYTYDIGNGNGPQTSNEFLLLGPDTYTITVSNMDGSCSETFTETLVGRSEITATVAATDVSCAGENDGQATVTPSGGVGPYTYEWSGSTETSETITAQSGGGLFVTVTDANLCSEVFPTVIGESTPITVTLDNQTQANCDGSGGATATVNVNGGAPGNYTYNWSAGTPNGNQVTDLNAGVVTVIVEDMSNCQSLPFEITITAPDPVTLMEDQLTAETCFGEDDGTVTVTTSGGNGPFNFDIDGGTTQTDNEFRDLAPGTYDVNVTDLNGCTSTVEITIPAATQITGTVDVASDLTVCNGIADGSVTITAAGGNGNLMYQLDNGTPQASNVFNNLGGGNYTITVIDGNTCSIPVPVTVTELSEIMLDVNLASSDLTICDSDGDGIVSIDANGGDNNFQYTLLGGGPTQPSNEFTGLSGGNYTVQVTDGNGCTNDVNFTVTELMPIVIDLDAVASDQIVCSGESDGTVTFTASGGDNNLTYDIGFGSQNNGEFNGLAPNNYTLTVMDGNMCSETFNFTVDLAPAITVQVDAAASDLDICDGDTDGSVTIDANGGDSNFMYTLGGVTQASPIFNNLPANVYTGTVEDGNGCSEPISVTVIASPAITANITASDLMVCNGFTDGSVTITASGGDDNFTYTIDGDDQASNVFNDLTPGPHTVMITDGNGCTTAPVDFTVVEGPAINASVEVAASDLLVCDGFTDGSITIMASGGTGGLMYSIDNNNTQQASNEFTNLGEGNYTIMITDADGCSPMAVPVTIDAAAPVTGVVDPISNLSICNGETIGSVTINGSGGDGNLMYSLNNGTPQASNVFNDLPAGNYSIDIVDGNGCTTTPVDFAVQEAPALTVAVDPNSDLINCFGDADGSVTINASGGNGGFMYDIGNGPQASNTFNNLAPGDYTIMVTDVNNCPSAPVDITVVEATVLDGGLTLASSDLTVCSGFADGTAAIEATGGDGNYTYVLDNNPGQVSNIFNDLGEGNYTVTIIDGNGCEQPVPFTVAPAPAITYTTDITNVGCFGEAEGQIIVNVLAGDGPFDFAWSNLQVTETAQLLTAGPHTVTITDINMCEVIETFNISEPAAALNIDPTAVIQPATCGDTNGSVVVTVSGGTAPYAYEWSDIDMSTDPDLINVGPGSYTVTITDANLCEVISESFSVSEPGALEVNPAATPVACNGDNTGAISLDVQGGTGPYTYVWSDDDMETTGNRVNLIQGTYTVVVSDSDGCELPAININIPEPPALTTTLTPTQAGCGASDGSVSLLVEGGTGVGTYTYAWSNGTSDPNLSGVPAGIYDVTVTDQNMCPVISMTTEVTNPGVPTLAISGENVSCFGASTGSIMLEITGGSGGNTIDWGVNSDLNGLTNPTNLPAGTYNVTVRDMSMCEATETITITEPTSSVFIDDVNAIIQPATCGDTNGSVSINVSGGTAPYTYQWSDGITTDPDLINVGPGNYILTVTDANMCTAISGNLNVSEPGALTVNPTSVPVSCNGDNSGSISLDVQGGTGPYTFAWSDIGDDISNRDLLPQGTYTVVVGDASGCELPAINIEVSEPDVLTAINTPVMANCGQSNGAINVTVSGGTEPYSFAWNDDGNTTTEDLSNVPAGSYILTVTDFNMCEFIMPTAEVENPNPPVVGITSTNVTCNNTATGTATVTATGGSGVYTYTWSDPTFNGQANPTTLPIGTYTVTVSDNLNCSAEETITITEPELLVLTTEQVVEATCGEANGSVSIGITGGTMPYTFDWSNGATTEDIQNLVPANYILDVMDANGCMLTQEFVVSEPNALTLMPGPISQVDCPGGDNGSIQVIADGGSGIYTFLWSNGDTDEINDNLTAGTYSVTVMDTDGCSFEYSETISEPEPIMITGTTTDAVCGEANGSINLTVVGGTGDYTFVWDNGAAPVEDPGSLPAGQYNVTVTDQNGCEAAPFDIAVTSPNAPVIEVASTPITCNGANDGSIDLTVTGGQGMVTLTWSDPAFVGSSVDNLPPGLYTITAEDEAGCTFPVNVTIDEPLLLEAFVIDPQSSTLCNGSADGSLDLNVQGGTGEYTYQWTNGAGTMQDPENLAAGIYDVIVTDANGCTAFESALIVEPDAIALTADPIPASCSNTADGGIEVSVIGGTGDYTYEWNGGLFTDEDLSDLQPGNYTLVVSDQNSCNGTIDVIVPAPAPVVISLADVSNFNGFNTSCNESEDGFITVSAEGGNSGYSYLWVDGTDGPTISDIGQGSYSVIVTDQEGCTGENNFSLDGPAPITVDVETDEPECFGESNGVVIINEVQGGRLPYRFSLNNGDYTTAQFFGNLGSGTYSLAVEDANGCTSDLDVVVDEVEEITVSLSDEPVIEITLGDSITLAPQPSIALDSNFVWSVSAIAEDTLGDNLRPVVRPFNTTSYQITIMDEMGCTATDELLVQVNKPRSIYIPNAFNPNSTNGNNVFTIHGGQDVSMVRSVRIFNRWGEIVYSDQNFPTDNPLRGSWDGFFRTKEAQSGVYVYIIEVDFIDGFSETYSGDVTLLR